MNGTGAQMRDRPTTRSATSRARAIPFALLALAALPGPAFAAEELQLIPELGMLILMVAIFFALIFPVNAFIFKPIFQALDERASRIAGARERADQIAAEADAVLERYEASIREARASAEAARKELIEAARQEQASVANTARGDAEELVEKARVDLAAALDEARAGLRSSSQEIGRLAAERILGRTL